ncbi:META domain-containing protein [Asticcacaulis sp.]|uniref:META domain-containing protein n=1 Tax=Asticcacaulis sp. TaxID=1872648 RepID=UPI002CB3BA68|nr:META domain-containing protein [Asticcacaulis sp.]HTM81205.1 META domain-containing protein [Asticcacaulis sp.]
MIVRTGFLIAATLALSACATASPQASKDTSATVASSEPPKTLVGTWQLTQFQPNDVSIAPVKPDTADKYELTFLSGGRAAMKVDCNRATAIWEMTPTDGTHGHLTFGPLAMTRMACPTPGLDTKWELNANSIADYAVDGDTLSLGLEGGKGTYTWTRKKD